MAARTRDHQRFEINAWLKRYAHSLLLNQLSERTLRRVAAQLICESLTRFHDRLLVTAERGLMPSKLRPRIVPKPPAVEVAEDAGEATKPKRVGCRYRSWAELLLPTRPIGRIVRTCAMY